MKMRQLPKYYEIGISEFCKGANVVGVGARVGKEWLTDLPAMV